MLHQSCILCQQSFWELVVTASWYADNFSKKLLQYDSRTDIGSDSHILSWDSTYLNTYSSNLCFTLLYLKLTNKFFSPINRNWIYQPHFYRLHTDWKTQHIDIHFWCCDLSILCLTCYIYIKYQLHISVHYQNFSPTTHLNQRKREVTEESYIFKSVSKLKPLYFTNFYLPSQDLNIVLSHILFDISEIR